MGAKEEGKKLQLAVLGEGTRPSSWDLTKVKVNVCVAMVRAEDGGDSDSGPLSTLLTYNSLFLPKLSKCPCSLIWPHMYCVACQNLELLILGLHHPSARIAAVVPQTPHVAQAFSYSHEVKR